MRTILVADEDNRVRNIFRLIFTVNRGYRVVSVSNGKDAVLKAKQIKPDIVIADVSLSDKDGYQISREIKNDLSLKDTSVILLHSEFASFDKEKALNACAVDVITKPFGTEIVHKIESLINRHEKKEIEFDSFLQTEESYIKKDIAKLAMFYGQLIGQKNYVLKSLRIIIQVFDENLKDTYRIAKEFTRNFKVVIGKLKRIEFPLQILRTKNLRIVLVGVLRKKYIVNTQGISKKLKDCYQMTKIFKENSKVKIHKLEKIKIQPQLLLARYLTISSEEISIKKHIAKFKIFYTKLIEEKKYNSMKSFGIFNKSVINKLEDCYQLVVTFTKNFKVQIAKLRDIKIYSRILMVSSVKNPLLWLDRRRSLIVLLNSVLVLFIIVLVVFSTNRKQNISSFVSTSRPIMTGFSQFESRPNFGISLLDHKDLEETFGDPKSEYLKNELSLEVITKENERPSLKQRNKTALKARKWKITPKSKKTGLSKRELEEVLSGAFLIQ